MIKSRLKVLLAVNDMNQKQLAEKTAIRPATISNLYRGTIKHIPVDVMDKICKTLNCQPGDLLEYRPDDASRM